ncbi:anti-sigma factor domain-containing protein [Silvibacterium sp.]|uniref:anti-sigma factor n=1 Tax=Silvibacterium sp. TaxID=1964179 RepID=UPI0039E5B2DB
MTDPVHISPDDLALFALGALSPDESAAVASHVSGCEQCRRQLAELHGDMSLLAFTAPERQLPAAARDRFLASIATASKQAQEEKVKIHTRPFPSRSFARSARIWQSIAAVLFIILALHAYKVHTLQQRSREDRSRIARLENENRVLRTGNARAQQIFEILTAPDAQHIVLVASHLPPDPQGHLTYIASQGSILFQASHLKPLPPGKTYELWLIPANGSSPLPAGLFTADASGNGSVVLPPIPRGIAAKAFGVTMEQASGSATPTLPILLAGSTG